MIKYGTNNIGKIYFGSNLIGKAYLGSNLVYSSAGPQPPEPQYIPYIRGGADGSYIDTGITADNTTRVIVWARNWQPYSEALFGSRIASSNGEFVIAAVSGVDVDRVRVRFGTNVGWVNYALPTVLVNYHKYEYANGVFSVDDVVISSASATTFSNNLNIHLFGLNNGGTHTAMNSSADIFACRIYKNDVLVRDFKAVDSPSIGLYDSVGGTLFTNAGTGSFTSGTFLPEAIIPLEYVECSGCQYFDSGVYAYNTMDFVAKFRVTGTTNWPELFTAQTSQTSKRFGIGFGSSTNPNTRLYFILGAAAPYITFPTLKDRDLIVAKSTSNAFFVYEDNKQLGTLTPSAPNFQTDYPIYVCVGNHAGKIDSINYFYGRFYYLKLGNERSYIPVIKDGVVGMYDTYNDVFYPSISDTPFIAGPQL